MLPHGKGLPWKGAWGHVMSCHVVLSCSVYCPGARGQLQGASEQWPQELGHPSSATAGTQYLGEVSGWGVRPTMGLHCQFPPVTRSKGPGSPVHTSM